MRQRMELTRTNRSCGLTTYFPIISASLRRRADGRRHTATHAVFEARREIVQVIAFRNTRHPFPFEACLIVNGK